MAITVSISDRLKSYILNNEVRLTVDTMYMALMVEEYSADLSTQSFTEISSLEIPETVNYIRGGALVTDVIVSTDDLYNYVSIGGFEFNNLLANVRYAVMYADIVTPLGIEKPIVLICDFGEILKFNNTKFEFSWPQPVLRW